MDKKNKNDSNESFTSILQKNMPLFAKILRRFSMSTTDIEDVTQETLLRALEARKKKNIHNPKQFMLSIAKNVAREEFRRRARVSYELLEDSGLENHPSEEPGVEQVVDGREKMRSLTETVAAMPRQRKAVFVLKHIYGASHKEISAKLGISVSTVEKHVAAGLKSCQQKMLQDGTNEKTKDTVQYLFRSRD